MKENFKSDRVYRRKAARYRELLKEKLNSNGVQEI